MKNNEPLAFRMSPRTLEDFIGQEHILSKGKLLYRMILADRITSIILFGPPGVGKTSIARIIANSTKSKFYKLNAVSSGVQDIKNIVEEVENRLLNPSGKAVLFIDEIHRFNKAQQDALLPYVEKGTISLIGATTENPYYSVNKALISRSTVFELMPLEEEHIKDILLKAIKDKERGLGNFNIEIEDSVIDYIAKKSNGDARTALNALELAVMTTDADNNCKIKITENIINECISKKQIKYDKNGNEHYNNTSALIKSMRGSDPDAAVFYLARALSGGEDPLFIARRILICAAEDVGLANPNALILAQAAYDAVSVIGMPEARIILAEAAIYVAVSPKSNSAYKAIEKAIEDIKNKDTGEVPLHLINPVFEEMKNLGYGRNYKYAHDYPGNFVKQQYLPDKIKESKYYFPTKNGNEVKIYEWLENTRKKG